MTQNYVACKNKVHNRGKAPDSFLDEIIEWAKKAPSEIFAPNPIKDIYSSVRNQLGPFEGEIHRKAVMLEVLRVLAGFESSWNWMAGVDVTNPESNTNCTEEAGIFQCSGDSMKFDASLKKLLINSAGLANCVTFKNETKKNHRFAIEYCARLLRFTISHHGPIKYEHIHTWLNRAAVKEFEDILRS